MFSILPEPRPSITNALLVIAVMSVAAVVYNIAGRSPPPLIGLFITFAPAIVVGRWFQKYLRQVHFGMPFDFGYFLIIGWPILFPVIAKQARVAHPWRLAFVLYALALAPILVSFLMSMLIFSIQ